MADVPYEMWMEYIAGIWSLNSLAPSSVLDMACGTGSITVLLAKRGLWVTGLDASPSMLSVARRKLAAEGLHATLIEGDMRSFSLDEPVDAVVSLFDSLNYLIEPADIQSAFRSVHDAMNPGGLFIFDVNTPERLSAIETGVHVFEGRDYFLVWSDGYDKVRKWWKVRLTGFMKPSLYYSDGCSAQLANDDSREINGDDLDDGWMRFDEVHRERAFPVVDVKEWLLGAGFEVVAVYDSQSFRPVNKHTSRAYFVARRR
jgi:SAM-dependent methyltransferase